MTSAELSRKLAYREDEPFDCTAAMHTASNTEEFVPVQTIRRAAPLANAPSITTKQKSTSYRLRRMQLTQQRKMKEAYIERAVQSKSSIRDTDDDYTIGSKSNYSTTREFAIGKELLIEDAGGMEISISNQLQKNGFDSSLLPYTKRFDFSKDTKNVGKDDWCHDDRSTAMDTVSSLNSTHYENALDDEMSKRKGRGNAKEGIDAFDDPIHPPLYVSSVQKAPRRSRISNEKAKNRGGFDEDKLENKLLSNIQGGALKNISVTSPFNTSATSLNKSVNPLDKTQVVSNKESMTEKRKEVKGKENDIPWNMPTNKKIENFRAKSIDVSRERPIQSQILNCDRTADSPKEEPPSLVSSKSPTMLRRRRLQLLYLHGSSDETGNENSDSRALHNEKDIKVVNGIFDTVSNEKSKIKIGKEIDQREKTDVPDDASIDDIMSIKSVQSVRSVQTYATLRSCMTIEPSSREEMKRMLKSKQRKIYLIDHALTCTYPHATDPDDETYVPCPEVRYCQALGTLVKHVQTCTSVSNGNGQSCSIPGCGEFKKMWMHYRRCLLRKFTGREDTKKCRLCGDLWKKVD